MKINFSIGMDANGNKVLRVMRQNRRGFSVQTNGNLLETHRNGVCDATPGEVRGYVAKYGTEHQKNVLKG